MLPRSAKSNKLPCARGFMQTGHFWLGSAILALLVTSLVHQRYQAQDLRGLSGHLATADATIRQFDVRITEADAARSKQSSAPSALPTARSSAQNDQISSLAGGSNTVTEDWYSRVEDIPANSTVWVTFVNGDEKYREMMLNWAFHLRVLNVPHVVAAFDDVAAAVCSKNGVPFIRRGEPLASGVFGADFQRRFRRMGSNKLPIVLRLLEEYSMGTVIFQTHEETLASGDFRADFSKFRRMGSNKPLIVLRLLEKYSLGTVILSDVDTVWLRDPSDFLARHPTADILISTDCLSHWVEAQHEPGKSEKPYFHRCGHLPGASFGRAFNTGVVIFRNRNVTLTALRAWRQVLTNPQSMFAPTSKGALAITDQLAFNMILEQNISPITSTESDWRVIHAMNATVRLMPLPVLLFTNGHTFFYQHLPQRHHAQAYVVHCTFQWHHTPGKRARLREHGLWLPDPPDYFKASHFMTYDNDVREYITNLDAKASSPLPSLFKHFHAMSYQLAQMRDAFAMARALNRTLVLPTWVCYCDQDWYASVLTKCRVDGSDLELPFECPLDTALNPGNLDSSPLPYRMASFLSDPRTPPRVHRSQEEVVIDADAAWVARQRSRAADVGGFAVAGAEAGELQESLRWLRSVHVLRFWALRPGSFGGFGTVAEDDKFDKAFAAAMGQEAKWCCSGEQPIDVEWVTWRYLLPQPLTQGNPTAWRIPRYKLPAHCTKIKDKEAGDLNAGFLRKENHPCAFLSQGIVFPEALPSVMPPNVHGPLDAPK